MSEVQLMVDIEALGDDCLVQIGAATFLLGSAEPIDTWLINVDPRSPGQGLPDARTVMWWLSQSKEAQDSLRDPGQVPLFEALKQLRRIWADNGCQAMWSHASYDAAFLARSYQSVDARTPWNRKQVMDLRTALQLRPGAAAAEYPLAARGLVGHRADHDCVKQIRVLAAVLAALGEEQRR